MSYNTVANMRKAQTANNCTDHVLSIQISDTKFKCENCGCVEDIRSLNNDSRSSSSAAAIDTGRAQY